LPLRLAQGPKREIFSFGIDGKVLRRHALLAPPISIRVT
jgi:hypothetical protein